jgi:hypothetical protein
MVAGEHARRRDRDEDGREQPPMGVHQITELGAELGQTATAHPGTVRRESGRSGRSGRDVEVDAAVDVAGAA